MCARVSAYDMCACVSMLCVVSHVCLYGISHDITHQISMSTTTMATMTTITMTLCVLICCSTQTRVPYPRTQRHTQRTDIRLHLPTHPRPNTHINGNTCCTLLFGWLLWLGSPADCASVIGHSGTKQLHRLSQSVTQRNWVKHLCWCVCALGAEPFIISYTNTRMCIY